MTQSHRSKSLVLALTLLCSACGTAPEVRGLAETTASNASIVNTELASFARNARSIAERRSDAIADLGDAAADQQVEFDSFAESARAAAAISGQAKKATFATLVVELQRVSQVVRERLSSAEGRSAAIKQEILASQDDLALPKDQLSAITKTLGSLAQEPSRKEQLSFLKAFFKEILGAIKEVRNASDKTAAEAEEAAAKVNGSALSPSADGQGN